jgi:hypothetical protein
VDRHRVVPTPAEFEGAVAEALRKLGGGLSDFKVVRSEILPGTDGCYEIDVTARFTAFEGAAFLVLVECKRYDSPIKREKVQVLHDKLRSVGAQKGMMVSTSRFQRGAVEYAEKHGIALIHLMNGSFNYMAKAGCVGLAGDDDGFAYGVATPYEDDGVSYTNLDAPDGVSLVREAWRHASTPRF